MANKLNINMSPWKITAAKCILNSRFRLTTNSYFTLHRRILRRKPLFPVRNYWEEGRTFHKTSDALFQLISPSLSIYFCVISQHCIEGERSECIDKNMVLHQFWPGVSLNRDAVHPILVHDGKTKVCRQIRKFWNSFVSFCFRHSFNKSRKRS